MRFMGFVREPVLIEGFCCKGCGDRRKSFWRCRRTPGERPVPLQTSVLLQSPRSAATPTPAPAAADPPTSDTPADANPFAVPPMVTRKAAYRRGRRLQSGLIAVVVVAVLLGGMVAGGVVLYPYLAGKAPTPGG